ncbi:hypothetical protein ScPMuIL_016200 [Solemya velum]
MALDICQSLGEIPHEHDDTEYFLYDPTTIKTEKPTPWMEEDTSPIYMDLSSYTMKAFKTESPSYSTTTDLRRWTQRHPEHWTPSEVLDWIFFVADQRGLETVRGESFQNVCGSDLCNMDLTGFILRDHNNGAILYEVFNNLVDSEKFVAPPPDVFKQEEQNVPVLDHLLGEDNMDMTNIIDSNLRLVPDGNGGMQVYLNNEWYPIDFSCTESMDFDSGYISDSNSDGSARHSSCSSDIFSDIETPKHTATPPTTKRRSKSRPSSSSSLSNDEGFESGDVKKPSNRGRKTGQLSKGNHLWEFIRDLLKTQSYNPALLKWEDKESGVFRFVQSEAVAQMWGRKKNNPGMTYEKLSRAMRYYYKRGILDRVDGRRLVYKFGPNSYGWYN